MRNFLPLLFILLLFTVPARADIRETDESYYGRLSKSCEIAVRTNWRDYLLYAPDKQVDQCCMDSVKKMWKLQARLAPSNRKCPPGTQINALPCTTSKSWCEKVGK